MIAMPLKWVPWVLLTVGSYGLFTGEIDAMACLVMLGIGGVWLVLKFSAKREKAKEAERKKAAASTTSAVAVKKSEPVKTVEHTTDVEKCAACHAELVKGTAFCPHCGHKNI